MNNTLRVNNDNNNRKFHTLAYTQTRIISVPDVSTLYKKQLVQRYNEKSRQNHLTLNKNQKKDSLLSNTFEEINELDNEQDSKYVTIQFSIKKRNKTNNLDNNFLPLNMNQISLCNKSNCNCKFINDENDELRRNLLVKQPRSFLNANAYVLSFKKYLFLSMVIIVSIIGLTLTLILYRNILYK